MTERRATREEEPLSEELWSRLIETGDRGDPDEAEEGELGLADEPEEMGELGEPEEGEFEVLEVFAATSWMKPVAEEGAMTR